MRFSRKSAKFSYSSEGTIEDVGFFVEGDAGVGAEATVELVGAFFDGDDFFRAF